MRVAKPRDWVPIGSPCTYAASAGISAAGRSQQPSPLLATPSPGATSRGTTATRPPTRSRTRPPSSHSPPRPMPTPSRTPRPGSQRCPTTRSPTRAEGSSGHGNGAGASRSRTNPGPAQAVTPGPAGLDTNRGHRVHVGLLCPYRLWTDASPGQSSSSRFRPSARSRHGWKGGLCSSRTSAVRCQATRCPVNTSYSHTVSAHWISDASFTATPLQAVPERGPDGDGG